jgi:hypothetical protein
MRPPSPKELLAAWERGLRESPVERALTLLACASPESTREILAHLSIGERDRRLLTIREWTFGTRLVCAATCPECEERIESTFDVRQIRLSETEAAVSPNHETRIETYTFKFRLPNSMDLVTRGQRNRAAVGFRTGSLVSSCRGSHLSRRR